MSYEGTISKEFSTETGHRLPLHEGKCRSLHGHRYIWKVTLAQVNGTDLDNCGRLLDFGEIKKVIGGWLDAYWDHAFIAQGSDRMLPSMQEDAAEGGTKLYVVDFPPSIENLTRELFQVSNRLFAPIYKGAIRVVHVNGYETATSSADYPHALGML